MEFKINLSKLKTRVAVTWTWWLVGAWPDVTAVSTTGGATIRWQRVCADPCVRHNPITACHRTNAWSPWSPHPVYLGDHCKYAVRLIIDSLLGGFFTPCRQHRRYS